MRPQTKQITLNEQERVFIRMGLQFLLSHQTKALATSASKETRASQGYSPLLDRMLKRVRYKLASKNSNKFRFDAIEVLTAQKALRVFVERELWKGTNTNAGKHRKKEPERILANLGTKLENYRRCRKRQALKSPKHKAYLRHKARWKRYTQWLRLALKCESNTTGFKGNVPKATPCKPATESIRNADADPLFEMLCKMLEKDATAYESELRAVVRNVRQALRRSSVHHQISLEAAVENPEEAINVLRLFIWKSPTLRKHLKLEHESPDVQQSTRAEKFRRALALQDNGGASIRSDANEYKEAVSPKLGATASSDHSHIKPVIPDLTTAAANGTGSVGGATMDCKVAAGASSDHTESLTRGVSADETALQSCPSTQISAPVSHCGGADGEGGDVELPTTGQNLITDEEAIFGVALFLSRSKVAPGSWHDLIGQSRRMMSANRPLISGQSSSSETVTFERIIEESRPGKQWKLGIDDIRYSALWILMAVEKVRGNQNDVRHLLDEGLNLAWNKLVSGKQC
jgi:hypothetical protein